ncbi:MAG: ATP synthase F1 subunit gamma [Anaerolineaceae bacterium]|nr:ATP synthase F1 subunit gamma [Anaerolineaceae bacterium]MBN2677215.1 ATP synthase F1 subunit gamma [Anaerolineaceae bacterium]
MATAREMRLRLRSIQNIIQVTKALEAVSAAKVRKAVQAVNATQPYAIKAWKVLIHLVRQPGHDTLHPLLRHRDLKDATLVVFISGDRGLAGAYNINAIRETLLYFKNWKTPVEYLAIGSKGRDLLMRHRKKVTADFSGLPAAPSFLDVSAIGKLAIDDYLSEKIDQVFLAYTEYVSMVKQQFTIRRLLPFEIILEKNPDDDFTTTHPTRAVFTFEPGEKEVLEQVVTRFTSLQIYQAILSSLASEHAARMVSMRNATDNAHELMGLLQLDYNKVRQQSITNEMLDIVGGAEALKQVAG